MAAYIRQSDKEKLAQLPIPYDRVDVHIVYIPDQIDIFPINVLRNIAVRYARADNVLISDIDFRPVQVYTRWQSPRYHAWLKQQGHAFVIPAFETEQDVATWSPEVLREQLALNLVQPFHPWGRGHRPTNVTRWLQSRKPYYVEWQEWYEPYFILSKSVYPWPWFDERFYGTPLNHDF